MKKPEGTGSSLLCLWASLLLDWKWALGVTGSLAAGLLFKNNLLLCISLLLLVVWLVRGVLHTALIHWGNAVSNAPAPPARPNKNPYSATGTGQGQPRKKDGQPGPEQ